MSVGRSSHQSGEPLTGESSSFGQLMIRREGARPQGARQVQQSITEGAREQKQQQTKQVHAVSMVKFRGSPSYNPPNPLNTQTLHMH